MSDTKRMNHWKEVRLTLKASYEKKIASGERSAQAIQELSLVHKISMQDIYRRLKLEGVKFGPPLGIVRK